jgi:hypothetical protein
MYNYSKDAELLISSLKEFDREKFEKWYKEKNIFISIQDYLQYIVYMNDEKIKIDLTEKIKDIEIYIDLKFQTNLISIIKKSNIDIDFLKRFYIFCIKNIGSGAIIQYLNKKEV